MTRTLIGLFALTTLSACTIDMTSEMEGDYTGPIVIDEDVIATEYTVSVSAVDGDTVEISGADFDSFTVDVIDVGGTRTSLVDDEATTLTFDLPTLTFVHEGAQSVDFTGDLDGAGGGDDTGGDDTGSGGDEVSAGAAGSYNGVITGPVTSVDYDLTVSVVDATTVELSGPGIDSFEIPVVMNGTKIEQAGNYSDGSFVLDGAGLVVTHDPQSLSFTGDKQ